MNKKTIGALAALVLIILLVYAGWRNQEPVQSAEPEPNGETSEIPPEEEEETFSACDYVEAAPYDSIEAEAAPVKEVDQADIQTEIDRFLAENEQLKEVLDRSKVQRGDTVGVDYTVSLDGTELTDKKTEDLKAEIGTGTLPGSIEDGLVGKEKGSTTEFKVTLPQDYQDGDLAGKDAVFKVTVKNIYIYKIPDLSDEFLSGLGKTDDEGNPIDTVDKLKDYFRKQLESKAQAEHDEALNTVILNYLMENSTFKQEIPAEFTDRMEAAYKKMYREYARTYGEDLPTFMARIGSTQETYEEDIRKIAEQYSRQVLILQAIGEKENLLPDEKEMQDYAEKTAADFGYESAKDYEKDFPIELVYDNLICDKVLAYLRGNVKPVSEEEPAAEEETAAEEKPAAEEGAPEGAQ